MSYVLRRTDQGGGFVAKSGHVSSYVRNLAYAQKFRTYKEADASRCVENEAVENLETVLDYYQQ